MEDSRSIYSKYAILYSLCALILNKGNVNQCLGHRLRKSKEKILRQNMKHLMHWLHNFEGKHYTLRPLLHNFVS